MKNFTKNVNKKAIVIKDGKKKKKAKLQHSEKNKKKKLANTSNIECEEDAQEDYSDVNQDSEEAAGMSVPNYEEMDSDDNSNDEFVEKHKEALKNLAKIDPEFHEFLHENDRALLNFESCASEDEDEAKEEQYHEPPEFLEVASDASDFEDESSAEVFGKITIQMVNAWEKELDSNTRSLKPVKAVVRAFHGCLVRISMESSSRDNSNVRVDGSEVFNAVVRLCVTSLYPYLKKVMKLPSKSVTKKHVESSKKWSYTKSVVRSYLIDLVKLLNNVTSEDVLRVLLKHLHQMIPFAACLPTISKALLKQVITLWSTNNDDTVRVISFLCLLRYAASDMNLYLHTVLKKMYMSYVANCKFVSQNSLPAINFLRKSLAEMFSLSEPIAYNHAFLYIRQLAIYLRAAITLKKKDSIQTVYNWQFISSLRLWVDVLCNMREKQQMNSLIYPTIQIIIGCIKLVPTAQYFPLRFHCIQMLIKLSKEVEVFIPVLPFLIEALSILNASSKMKKLSMKPMDFTYILRLSKSELQGNAFKDAVVENVHDCLLEYTVNESHRISFPDMVVFLQMQLKQFLKECKNANYSKKFKPLLEKIDEVSKMMTQERSQCGIALSDVAGISAWESNMKLKKNPLINFYETWCAIQKQKATRKIVDEIQYGAFELPVLKKLPAKKKQNEGISKSKILFDSDENDDTDLDFEKSLCNKGKEDETNGKSVARKSKKSKRKIEETDVMSSMEAEEKKTKKKTRDDLEEMHDIVKNFNLDQFLS